MISKAFSCSVLSWFIVGGLALLAQDSAPDAIDKDYSVELPRIPPKSTAEELHSFEILPGFTVELVASEPLVADPIAFAFDAREQLFVVEMKDYSEQETECLGMIALLKDTNHDGKMDARTTFVEGLSWPTAIWPWRDGVLVAEPPRITWFRDTNDDGKSDTSEIWFDGFQRTNVQGLVNSLRWGVDGYVHGATSSSGADLVQLSAGAASESKLQLRGRDFVIDPLRKTIAAESGGGQHGMNFNRWGDKFVTSNSDHLQQIVDLDRWLSQHASSVVIPSLRRSIAEDGPQAEVFRASPVEPWRIVRTRLRMSGVAPGIVEGGGRAAGYFTGATATLIMDSEAGFGVAGFDTALVCDVGSNLVHRKQLCSNGLFWKGTRIDAQTEILRSSDIWFRPVQLGDGPDGAVYIADMYREVIEHPKSLPPMIKKHLDLTSGRDRGRIWRLKPLDLSSKLPKPTKSIADCSNLELVARLASPVAWQRRAASQMLIERGAQDVDIAAVSSALRQLIDTAIPEARILALHCLYRLGQFDQTTALKAMENSEPHVQSHAIALLRTAELAPAAVAELKAASSNANATVQLQLALTAVELPVEERLQLLGRLIKTDDSLVRAIVLTAAGNDAAELITDPGLSPSQLRSCLEIMLPAWTKQSDQQLMSLGVAMSRGLTNESTRASWLSGLRSLPAASSAAKLLKSADSKTVLSVLSYIESDIKSLIAGTSNSSDVVAWLGLLAPDRQQSLGEKLLVPAQSEAFQLETIEALLWSNPGAASRLLIDRFQNLTPALQQSMLNGLLRYRTSLPALARAIEDKKILSAQIAPDVRVRLLASNDKSLNERFASLLQSVAADRAAVIEKYSPALTGIDSGDGKLVFQRVCAQCHRLGDIGNDVGPPLKQLSDKSPQQLLETILDPNREVDPKFASYSVLLQDGRVFAGIIAEESSSQIVLSEAGGKRHTIPRGDIEQLRSTGVSLMPTGLEQQITPEQMNQLIHYLKHASQK